ncbi:MAG: chorismate synthase [Planctomycetota bacterium]|jgi:chorismate synthase
MSSNSFGNILRMTTFGESHGAGLGVVIDGCPSGLELAADDLMVELARRRPGQSSITTARVESDEPEILSGVFEGKTTGMPIAVLVRNTNQKPKDYDHLRDNPRVGHADEAYAQKYEHRDHRGGGRSSGRETLARVIGGVVARKILPAEVRVLGHCLQVGPVVAEKFDAAVIETNAVRCADQDAALKMIEYIEAMRDAHNSVGGLVEVRVQQPPAGLGDPVFRKLKARLADAIMSVGAVTGFSYGVGFGSAELTGLEYVANRQNFGGILGGISTGDDIVMHASIKPTSSIKKTAETGRHDPCIVPRVIPVLEAMVAFVLADAWLQAKTQSRD